MNSYPTEYLKTDIHPIECYRESWRCVKDQYWLLLGVTLVGILVGSLAPFGILLGPMLCGVYLCCFARMRGAQFRFDTLFHGFDFFLPSLVAFLIQFGVKMAILLPVWALFAFIGFTTGLTMLSVHAHPNPSAAPFVAVSMIAIFLIYFAFIMIAGFVVVVVFAFAYPLIVDRKLSGPKAVALAAKAAWNNLAGMVGLILVVYAVSIAGALCCYVGLFFTMPITFGAITVAYRKVFPEVAKLVPSP